MNCPHCNQRIGGVLMDQRAIMDELGVTRSTADRLMRQLPKVSRPGGIRKTFVRRADLERLLDESTRAA